MLLATNKKTVSRRMSSGLQGPTFPDGALRNISAAKNRYYGLKAFGYGNSKPSTLKFLYHFVHGIPGITVDETGDECP